MLIGPRQVQGGFVDIQEIMHRLDIGWSKQPFDDNLLIELLQLVPPEVSHHADWKIELCAADLEHRWTESRRMSQSALDFSGQNPVGRFLECSATARSSLGPFSSTIDTAIPRRPRAVDYKDFLGQDWHSKECRRKLILAEWQTRCVSGDEPDISGFITEFDGEERWQAELHEALATLSAVELQVSRDNRRVLHQFLPPRFVFGRQVRGEPGPPAWLPEKQKLVIIGSECTNFSRRQLEFCRRRTREFEVLNTSRNVTVDLGSHKLLPGQSQRFATPIKLQVPTMAIQIGVKDV